MSLHQPPLEAGGWGSFLCRRWRQHHQPHSCSYSTCCCCAAGVYSKLLRQIWSFKVCHRAVLCCAEACLLWEEDVVCLWCIGHAPADLALDLQRCAVLCCVELLCFFGYVRRQPATSSSSLPLATNTCKADLRGAAAGACIRQLSRQCCLAGLIPVMPSSSIINPSTARWGSCFP